MNVLVVDDEPLARARLVRLLADHAHVTVVAEAGNGEDAIAAVNSHKPDVVLMDIRMPVMDGLMAARHLAAAAEPPAVIFCTAYGDYALDAFEANAVDYLLKPVNRDKLLHALHKAQRLNRLQLQAMQETVAPGSSGRTHIAAKTSRGVDLLPLDDIRYFYADQKYVTVYFVQDGQLRERLIDEPLKELEQEFAGRFVRIHRNALVSSGHIDGTEKTDEGLRLKLQGVADGPLVSRRHLAEIRKLLQQL